MMKLENIELNLKILEKKRLRLIMSHKRLFIKSKLRRVGGKINWKL